MDRAGVRRNVLWGQDVCVSPVRKFVMEGVRSRGKSPPGRVAVIEREFLGARIERQVLAHVFEVLWQDSESPAPSLASLGVDRPLSGASRISAASRVLEGVAS